MKKNQTIVMSARVGVGERMRVQFRITDLDGFLDGSVEDSILVSSMTDNEETFKVKRRNLHDFRIEAFEG